MVPVSHEIFKDPSLWDKRISGKGFTYWVGRRNPVRTAGADLKCVIFLYPSKEDADNSREGGASGFIIGLPSAVFPEQPYLYAVTNRHVIENGASVIRFNTKDGGTDTLDLKPQDWERSIDDDLAVCQLSLSPQHKFMYLPVDIFLKQEDITYYDMDEGMEVYVVGRFVTHKATRNQPVARFGAVSLFEEVPIKQESGHIQQSLLVELHSISGYSGSPVFICLSRNTPGTTVTMGWDYKTWLMGVDWGHLPKWEPVRDQAGNKLQDNWKVNFSSGMTGVIPSWRLMQFLNCEELALKRETEEKIRLEEKEHCGILDSDVPRGT